MENKTQFMAKVFTKSNYKNLNNKWLEVIEIVGTRVTCWHNDDIINIGYCIDFALNEIIEFSNIKFYLKSK